MGKPKFLKTILVLEGTIDGTNWVRLGAQYKDEMVQSVLWGTLFDVYKETRTRMIKVPCALKLEKCI